MISREVYYKHILSIENKLGTGLAAEKGLRAEVLKTGTAIGEQATKTTNAAHKTARAIGAQSSEYGKIRSAAKSTATAQVESADKAAAGTRRLIPALREVSSGLLGVERQSARSMGAAERHARYLGGTLRKLAGAGAALGGAFVGYQHAKTAIESTVELGVQAGRMSRNLGISTQKAAELLTVSKAMGGSFTGTARGFSALSTQVNRYTQAGIKASPALADLHAHMKNLDGAQQALAKTALTQPLGTPKQIRALTELKQSYLGMVTTGITPANKALLSMTKTSVGASLTAAAGAAKSNVAWKQLGVTQADLKRGSHDFNFLLSKVADGFGHMKGNTDRAALAQRLLGRNWQTLLPLMNQGAKGLDAATASAGKYVNMNEKNVKQLEQLHQAQLTLKYATVGLQLAFTTAMLPTLLKMRSGLTDVAQIMADKRMNFDQKVKAVFDRIGKMNMGKDLGSLIQRSIPVAVAAAATGGPKIAEALVKAFVASGPVGMLLGGGWILRKMGVFSIIGKSIGAKLVGSVAPSLAGAPALGMKESQASALESATAVGAEMGRVMGAEIAAGIRLGMMEGQAGGALGAGGLAAGESKLASGLILPAGARGATTAAPALAEKAIAGSSGIGTVAMEGGLMASMFGKTGAKSLLMKMGPALLKGGLYGLIGNQLGNLAGGAIGGKKAAGYGAAIGTGAGIGFAVGGPLGALVGGAGGAALHAITSMSGGRSLGDAEAKLQKEMEAAASAGSSSKLRALAKNAQGAADKMTELGDSSAATALHRLSSAANRSAANLDLGKAGAQVQGLQASISASQFKPGGNQIAAATIRQLVGLGPMAQHAGAEAMIQFTAGMEAKHQIPKGSTDRLIRDLNRKYGPDLSALLRKDGASSMSILAAEIKNSAVLDTVQAQTDAFHKQWGLQIPATKVTGVNLATVMTSNMTALENIVRHSSGRQRNAALDGLKQMVGDARRQLPLLPQLMQAASAQGKKHLEDNIGAAVTAVQLELRAGVISTGQAMSAISGLLAGELKGLGVNVKGKGLSNRQLNVLIGGATGGVSGAIGAGASPLGKFPGKQAGGWIGEQGQRGRDQNHIVVGDGEAVLNFHQQRVVNSALYQSGIGGLDEVFDRVRTPHYMARGGFSGRSQHVGGTVVLDAGVDMGHGQEPQILGDLRGLSSELGQTVYVISGYRSPSHSVAVGGFANDPHTRGQAADIGIGSPSRASMFGVSEAKLRAVGLYRPFYPASAAEVNHVQLTGGGGGGGGGGGSSTAGAGGAGGMVAWTPIAAPRIRQAGAMGAIAQQASNQATRAANIFGARQAAALGAGGGGPSGGGNATNEALGRSMMLAAGWGASQWPALQALWTQESGWSSTAVNPSSGAYGIPQSLGHGHPYNLGDARGQIAWGLNYIRGRYGSPAAAEAHERSHNWYGAGGIVGGVSTDSLSGFWGAHAKSKSGSHGRHSAASSKPRQYIKPGTSTLETVTPAEYAHQSLMYHLWKLKHPKAAGVAKPHQYIKPGTSQLETVTPAEYAHQSLMYHLWKLKHPTAKKAGSVGYGAALADPFNTGYLYGLDPANATISSDAALATIIASATPTGSSLGSGGGGGGVPGPTGAGSKYNHKYPANGNTTFSSRLVAQIAENAGLPGVTFAQIARGESSYQPGAREKIESIGIGGVPVRGWGLWQMTTGVGNDALINQFGGTGEMLNPMTNAKAAKALLSKQGIGAWHGTRYMTATNAHWRGKPLGMAGGGYVSRRINKPRTAYGTTALGDSISDTRFMPYAWPSHGKHVQSAGVAGDGVAQTFARLHDDGIYGGWDWTKGDVAPYTRNTVVLDGVNDLFGDRSAGYVTGGLSQIYRRLRQHGSNVVPATILPFGSSPGYSPSRETSRLKINKWILGQPGARNLESALGSGSPTAYRSGYGGPDNIHPSPLGGAKIASILGFRRGGFVGAAAGRRSTFRGPRRVSLHPPPRHGRVHVGGHVATGPGHVAGAIPPAAAYQQLADIAQIIALIPVEAANIGAHNARGALGQLTKELEHVDQGGTGTQIKVAITALSTTLQNIHRVSLDQLGKMHDQLTKDIGYVSDPKSARRELGRLDHKERKLRQDETKQRKIIARHHGKASATARIRLHQDAGEIKDAAATVTEIKHLPRSAGGAARLKAALAAVDLAAGLRTGALVKAAMDEVAAIDVGRTRLDRLMRRQGVDSSSVAGATMMKKYQDAANLVLQDSVNKLRFAYAIAVKYGNKAAAADIGGKLTTALDNLDEGITAAVEAQRAVVQAAADQLQAWYTAVNTELQKRADAATANVSFAQGAESNFETQQQLAGTFDTAGGGAARAANITQQIIPAMQATLAPLYNQLAAAKAEGDAALASQFAAAIQSTIGDILAAQLTAQDAIKASTAQTAANTAQSGQLGVNFNGEIFPDLAGMLNGA